MLKLVIIPFFLLSCFQSTQESQKSNEKDSEQLSNPEFGSLQKSLEVEIGQNVTLSCQSTNGSLPINYTFFRGSQNLWPIIPKKDRNAALFNLTISSASDVGEYKCKVENRISNSSKYSKSLNFTLLDPVSKPVLSTTTPEVKIGQNVTLSCHSENGSSPINYIFFKGKKSMSSRISMPGKAAAELNVTINSLTDLADYKCKAENNIPNNTKYSNSLNFTLAGENGVSYPLRIFLVLLFLLVVTATALLVPFLILPWCKASEFFFFASPDFHCKIVLLALVTLGVLGNGRLSFLSAHHTLKPPPFLAAGLSTPNDAWSRWYLPASSHYIGGDGPII
uniref:Mast cell immunoglobulin like receptor 1 n=1 Tax=Chrysemys picta bellii TaxID=8478 RepID=A0A8C3FPD5_CHRPI